MNRSRPLIWTEASDSAITAGRAAGRSWDWIADYLGLTLYAVHVRAHQLGCRGPFKRPASVAPQGRGVRGGNPLPVGAGVKFLGNQS